MNVLEYAKGVERMVDPMQVGKVHYMQTKLKKMPVWLQKKIVLSAAKKANKMPFVVEPYCSFLFYEVVEPDKIQKFLPDGFIPARAAIFEGGAEKYYGIVSMFRIHTSVFWGARAEFYLVAKNAETGLLSWIMCDYISDTISYDEMHGLKSPDASEAVMTTTCEGDFVCDMDNSAFLESASRKKAITTSKKYVRLEVNLNNAKMKPLDQRLWIEGNTSIAYGRLAGEPDGDLFSLTFFPEEMKQALEVPMHDVRKAEVLCGTGKLGGKLERVVSFPYAQHMLSDSPGQKTHYGSEEKLRAAVEKVNFGKMKGL
ncbi:hypothetical protein IKG12_01030 [Candidatus Saccharibacteria bacterium]|nr:hypothetical protein [Candidatus Saccharibacteria bacterium]